MTHKKPNLPTKICPACNRPFAWRKRWAKVWEQVKYCSDACKKANRIDENKRFGGVKEDEQLGGLRSS
ncbi:MAG: DUF2256 domain-containing protein [Pirellulaceae bacterium]|nr:DUF2256 domain-containing protein [Pirellulaceae bacterium]